MANKSSLRVLYVESYGAGSHLRIANLLQQHSHHEIDIVRLARDHWRAISFLGHRAILDAIQAIVDSPPDLIIFSGPADLRQILSNLPACWKHVPSVAYFHESQWTYPGTDIDRIPHLVSHIETVEIVDFVWFNSRFHQRTFLTSALDHRATTVRSLARSVLLDHWPKTQVVYPPVHVGRHPVTRASNWTVAWSARWERDKRPDIMAAVIEHCLNSGMDIRLLILGCNADTWRGDATLPDSVRAVIDPRSGLLSRSAYEAGLASADIWLSTAEHEFYGVSAIEAAMLGATPVVPDGLAYNETLPSSLFYPGGNITAAADRIASIVDGARPLRGAWQFDARRFNRAVMVEQFDAAIAAAVKPD